MSNITFFSLILAFTGFMGFKSTQLKPAPTPEVGMFKVEIFYPNGEGKTFDMDYYEKKHMPMVAALLGENLEFYEINKGVAGRTPNDQAPFVAIGCFYITDVAAYSNAVAQNRDVIVADFKNYTNIQPVIQISKIEHVGYPGKK
ncbi:EthD family reductase [Parapedobacter sp. ISTM3]|uniref:EthD domain-containing protein n=1 Tax=Parapedobacter luteus TaxID=623280 RepID=A0A1T5BG88_9SPHI|nr:MULTISPECIES: EthD family reductase [Parapedobacter]MBK1439518.1 EthD family reductase [Parapedobacter sp. ISTM3]SKB46258.1 conserved hypothetical protein [Parapedobacter luteus]